MKRNIVVAEYDYYTLDQARKIIKKKKKKKKQEVIEEYLSIAFMFIIPILFVLYWITVGC